MRQKKNLLKEKKILNQKLKKKYIKKAEMEEKEKINQ